MLLTTIALCLLLLVTRGKERGFFCGLAVVWFFNMVLLSTVGRPVERYLMPLVAIMFWAMTGVLVFVWKAILGGRASEGPFERQAVLNSRGRTLSE